MFIFLANCSTASVDTHLKCVQCLNLKKNWLCVSVYHMQICTFVHTCELYFSCLCVSVTLESVFCWCSLLEWQSSALSSAFPLSQFCMLRIGITDTGHHHCWNDRPVISSPHALHLSSEFLALVLQTQATMPDCLHQAWGSEPKICACT